MKGKIVSILALSLSFSHYAMADSKYSPNETLFGGVNISQDGILTSQALFGCNAPNEVELKTAMDNSVQVTVKDTFFDCRITPFVQEFSIDLKPFLEDFEYRKGGVQVVNKIIFKYDELGPKDNSDSSAIHFY